MARFFRNLYTVHSFYCLNLSDEYDFFDQLLLAETLLEASVIAAEQRSNKSI